MKETADLGYDYDCRADKIQPGRWGFMSPTARNTPARIRPDQRGRNGRHECPSACHAKYDIIP